MCIKLTFDLLETRPYRNLSPNDGVEPAPHVRGEKLSDANDAFFYCPA